MSNKKIALVWFKTNLRLRDNECLVKAIAENDLVIPCYCLNDEHFQTTILGFKKPGLSDRPFLKKVCSNWMLTSVWLVLACGY